MTNYTDSPSLNGLRAFSGAPRSQIMRRSIALILAFALTAFALPAQAPPPDSAHVAQMAQVQASIDSVIRAHSAQPSRLQRAATVLAVGSLTIVSKSLQLATAGLNAATREIDASSCDRIPLTSGCERYVRSEIARLTDSTSTPYNRRE